MKLKKLLLLVGVLLFCVSVQANAAAIDDVKTELEVTTQIQLDTNREKYAQITISCNGLSVLEAEKQLNCQIAMRASYDGGKTWDNWIPLHSYVLYDDGYTSTLYICKSCYIEIGVTDSFPQMPYYTQDLNAEAKENGTLWKVVVSVNK